MTKKNLGFTLIELLVVIAIVGILSAVVLGALSSARSRGVDASIKSTMNNASAAAQVYYDIHNNSSWNTVCTANNGLNKIMTRLDQLAAPGDAVCNGTGQSGWVISTPLKENAGKFWCVDYTGIKKQCDNAMTAGVYICGPSC